MGNCFDFHNIFFADVPSVFKTMSGQDGVQWLGLLLHRLLGLNREVALLSLSVPIS